MRHRRFFIGMAILVLLLYFFLKPNNDAILGIDTGYAAMGRASGWMQLIADITNHNTQNAIFVDGRNTGIETGDAMLLEAENGTEETTSDMQWYVKLEELTDLLKCYVGYCDDTHLIVQRGNNRLCFCVEDGSLTLNGEDILKNQQNAFLWEEDSLYISAAILSDAFGYQLAWQQENNQIDFSLADGVENRIYPVNYDYRLENRMPTVRNQGENGDCWAFAAIAAMESSIAGGLNTELETSLSVDHMILHNNCNEGHNNGGNSAFSVAYLLSWNGPVSEADDPYNDGTSDGDLVEIMHLQSIHYLESKDYDGIKEDVFLYGGVQTSIYMDESSASNYYNSANASYCYIGTEKINHDIVIVGWDDNYPKENFLMEPEGNGAFICINSWGSDFGEEGCFYVSYYDSNIGMYNCSYIGIESSDNYDNIYQSDLCGMVGMLGYGSETAYFANHYKTKNAESLEAVGFYCVGPDTTYEIYVETGVEDYDSLSLSHMLTSGTCTEAGYYTISLDEAYELEADEDFVVAVKITTPGTEEPIAIEYAQTDTGLYGVEADICDGDGYISAKGKYWSNVEQSQQANVCLKAYTINQ